MSYDFLTAALPWVAIAIVVAIVCAHMDEIVLFWDKRNNRNK